MCTRRAPDHLLTLDKLLSDHYPLMLLLGSQMLTGIEQLEHFQRRLLNHDCHVCNYSISV